MVTGVREREREREGERERERELLHGCSLPLDDPGTTRRASRVFE